MYLMLFVCKSKGEALREFEREYEDLEKWTGVTPEDLVDILYDKDRGCVWVKEDEEYIRTETREDEEKVYEFTNRVEDMEDVRTVTVPDFSIIHDRVYPVKVSAYLVGNKVAVSILSDDEYEGIYL